MNQKDGDTQLNVSFSSSTTAYKSGDPVTFAVASCVSTALYTWTIKAGTVVVASATGTSFTYTFTQPGNHTVICSATHPFYKSISLANTICVDPNLNFNLVASNGLDIYRCDVNGNLKTFRAMDLQVASGGQAIYGWEYTNSSGLWQTILDVNNAPVTAPLVALSISTYAYSVRCSATVTYPVELRCETAGNNTKQITITTNYIDNRPCP
jgi:plastocyanin